MTMQPRGNHDSAKQARSRIRIFVAGAICGLGLLNSAQLLANPDTPPGVPNDPDGFLAFLNQSSPLYIENETTADAYYRTIDPDNLRLTLNDFKRFNDLSDDEVAIYVNDADLGFGRRMYVTVNPDGSVASCVENFGGPGETLQEIVSAPPEVKLANAKARNGLIATVCMEYTGTPGTAQPANGIPDLSVAPNVRLSGRKYVKFFTYGPDGSRITNADLDGRGAKYQPGLCNVCHGGQPVALENGVYANNGDTGAQFLPWDLDTFVYDTEPGFTRADLEPLLKKFNQAVLATYPQPQTFSFSGNVAIPDNGNVATAIHVAGVTDPITSITVSIDTDVSGSAGIVHDSADQLELVLRAPSGEQFILASSGTGTGPGDNATGMRDLFFSDNAEIVFRRHKVFFRSGETTEYSGTFMADDSLPLVQYTDCDPDDTQPRSDLGCTSANGEWQLIVFDEVNGGTGFVKAWSIHFNGVPDAAYTPAPVEMIRGWYGGKQLPSPTFNGEFVPDGWLAENNPGAPADTEELYLKVLGPTCRACHAQRGTMRRNEIDFSTYAEFMSYVDDIETLVYDEGLMPLAKRTYQNHFWPGDKPQILAQHMPRFIGGAELVKPGRPIAKAGVSRTGILAVGLDRPVILNGLASQFSETFQWTMLSKPAGSVATLASSNVVEPSFTPDLPGDYEFELTVSNATQETSTDFVTIEASASALPPVSFTNDIAANPGAMANTCEASTCHRNGRGPTFPMLLNPDRDTLFARVRERVNTVDPLHSMILEKGSGHLAHAYITANGGNVPGTWTPLSQNYNTMLRWVLEGAQDDAEPAPVNAVDLAIQAVSGPATASLGGYLEVSGIVSNLGLLPASAYVNIAFYLSKDQRYDIGDQTIGGTSVLGLAGEQSKPFSANLALRNDIPVGDYYLLAIVDFVNRIDEIDDPEAGDNRNGNNLGVGNIVSLKLTTDLAMEAVSAPSLLSIGQTFTANATVKNLDETARAYNNISVTFFLSTDQVYDTGDYSVAGGYFVGSLNPGESRTFDTEIMMSNRIPEGTYHLLAIVDFNNRVAEIDDPVTVNGYNGNNLVASTPIYLQLTSDLATDSVSAPATLSIGQSFEASAAISNLDSIAPVYGNIGVTFFLSTDQTFDVTDYSLAGGFSTPYLNPGQRLPFTRTLTMSSRIPAGDYYLLAIADFNNRVNEIDDPQGGNNWNGNNLAVSGRIRISLTTDLAMQSVSGSTEGYIGGTISIQGAVSNLDTIAPASGVIHVSHYLSTDTTFDFNDYYLFGGYSGRYIGPGATINYNSTPQITTNIPPGEYYIIAVVDAARRINEIDDPDNLNGNNMVVGNRITIRSAQ